MNKSIPIWNLALICGMLLAGCAPKAPATTQAQNLTDLTVSVVYPVKATEMEMGEPFNGIIKVLDKQGKVVKNAEVGLSVSDPKGKILAKIPATFGSGDVYRTASWTIPHKMQAGTWTLTTEAKTETGRGTVSGTFQVNGSLSEILLDKYGFWISSPSLKGIAPNLVKEEGDAQNGLIIWGGMLPAQHVFPESWLVIHWRKGDFKLKTANDVREFMLGKLGSLGFTPVRGLGPFQQVKFKNWNAWQVKARGQYLRYDEQWMIFYAPEVDKTYAIGTTVVLPPAGMDAHAHLRDSFEVHPELHAQGIAPEPLPQLLPSPELVGPEIGTRFFGTKQPIILKWQPVRELAEDEHYLVDVDYNYDEANPLIEYTTRETQLTLPESLYHLPNCGIFNWQVTLMHQTGTDKNGQPEGEPLSFNSLYWYIQWAYPPGEELPFKWLCPNAQF